MTVFSAVSAGAISAKRAETTCGLTARITISTSLTTRVLLCAVLTPSLSARHSRRSARTSVAKTSAGFTSPA